MTRAEPSYLRPYAAAAERFGGGFGSLLWASPRTQQARFDALARIENLHGRFILDAGCGRGDLLDFLSDRGVFPFRYLGLEAVADLAAAARGKHFKNATIVNTDFILQPQALDVQADIILFSGSLNTFDDALFYSILQGAFRAARFAVVFNFLSSQSLAGQPFLHWRQPADVLSFARSLSTRVAQLSDYLDGDCTLALRKSPESQ